MTFNMRDEEEGVGEEEEKTRRVDYEYWIVIRLFDD